jgi:hypothetical protein
LSQRPDCNQAALHNSQSAFLLLSNTTNAVDEVEFAAFAAAAPWVVCGVAAHAVGATCAGFADGPFGREEGVSVGAGGAGGGVGAADG